MGHPEKVYHAGYGEKQSGPQQAPITNYNLADADHWRTI
jgi:hypothetical protein